MKKYVVFLVAFLTYRSVKSQNSFQNITFHYSPNFIENKGQFDNSYFQTNGRILYAVDQNSVQIYFTDKAEIIYRIEQKIKNPDRKKGDISKPKKLAIREIIKSEWINTQSNFQVVVENPSSDYHNYAMLSPNRTEVYSINQIPSYGKLIYKNIYPNVDIVYEVKKEGGIKYSLILNPGANLSQISLKYDRNNLQIQDGKIIIPTLHGNIIEHQPYSYLAKSLKSIESELVLQANQVKYDLKNFPINEKIIFDPWVQTPSLPNSNGVWEVETDIAGNVYIIGGDMPMKLQKYSSAGVLQWTYNTPYDTANFWLGTMATDQAGFTYITSGSSANIQKINPAGSLVWNASGGIFDEYWSIAFNADQTRLIVGGTRLDPINISAVSGVIFDIDPNNGSQITLISVAGSRPGPISPIIEPNEVRSLSSSRNGRYYYLTLDSIGGLLKLFGSQANCPKVFAFQTNSGYNFAYKSEEYRPNNGNSGIKAIRANDRFIYTHNGAVVHRRDLNNGSILGTFNVPGGISVSNMGFNQPGNNGIEVDSCGNVYVGSSDRIIKLDPFLNVLQTVNLPFRVFDIAIGSGGEVIVCGATGNMNSTSRTGYVQAINMNACGPFPLVECDATICNVNAICQTASPFNLTAVTAGGTWSGTGITNPSAGTFDPSLAGPGTHWVYYTLPCGSDSIQIQVNSCATLNVCVESNGQFTVSGGSGTYTWQQLIPPQNITITNPATCAQCGGTWNPLFNQCFNPFPFPITSCTVPASYQTYATGTTTNPPTYYPIRIFTSAGDTVVLNSAPTQSCCTPPNAPSVNDTTICAGSSASLFASAPASATFHWYNVASGGTTLFTGNPFNTPILTSNTNYFVEAVVAGCTSSRTSVTVTVQSVNNPSVSDISVCPGNSGTFTATAPAGATFNWYDAPSGGTLLNTGSTFTTPPLTSNTSYYVEAIQGNCTSARVTVTANVVNLDYPDITKQVCVDSVLSLSVPNITGSVVNWYDKDGNILQTGDSLILNISQADILYFFDYVVGNCTSNRVAYSVQFYRNPIASFVTHPEKDTPTDIQNSTFTFMNNSQNGVKYVWYFGDGDSLVTNSNEPITHNYGVGEYNASLCVYNALNCVDCYQYGKIIVIEDFVVFIPNVFTPNGDGINDKFEYVLKGIKSAEIQIYDRWGVAIYFNENMSSFWDGNKNGKPCPEGVYTYVLKMVRNNGKEIRRMGSITLLR